MEEVPPVVLQPLFQSIQHFDPSEASFSAWFDLFQQFCFINNIADEPVQQAGQPPPPHNQKRALFLSYLGIKAFQVLRNACLPDSPHSLNLHTLVNLVKSHYEPADLLETARYQFHQRTQKENESVAEFIGALQNLASQCHFGQFLDDALRGRIVVGIKSDETRRKLLSAQGLTFSGAKAIAIQDELVKKQSKALAQSIGINQVNKVSFRSKVNQTKQPIQRATYSKSSPGNSDSSHSSWKSNSSRSNHQKPNRVFSQASSRDTQESGAPKKPCHRCGRLHNPDLCPAKKWQCYACNRFGHTSTVCRNSSQVHSVKVSNKESKDSQSSGECEEDKLVNYLLNPYSGLKQSQINHIFTGKEFVNDPDVIHIVDDNKSIHSKIEEELLDFSVLWLQQQSALMNLPQLCSGPQSSVGNTSSQTICEVIPSQVPEVPVPKCVYSKRDKVEVSKCFFNMSNEIQKCVPSRSNEIQNVTVCNNIVQSLPVSVNVKIEDVSILMEIDTGAGVSLIHSSIYDKFFSKVTLSTSSIPLKSLSGPICVKGQIIVKVVSPIGSTASLPLYVCESAIPFQALLGREWMDFLFPSWRDNFSSKIVCHTVEDKLVSNLKRTYPSVFDLSLDSPISGFKAELVLKENSPKIFHRAYSLPYSQLSVLENMLDELVLRNKAFPVSHSDYASPCLLVPKKDSSFRLCVDFKRTLNQYLCVDFYPLPNPEDIFAGLANGKTFCVLDLSDAYTQLELSDNSKELVTINTHKGLFRYNRLIYGLSSAPAIFQKTMDCMLQDIPNVYCYIDDILIKGIDKTDCLNTVHKVLAKLSLHNVRIKEEKCLWLVDRVDYLGFVISSEGRRPSIDKVSAISQAKTPTCVKEVKSFLGLLNFYSVFIPHLSTISKPIRQLTEKNVSFNWSEDCEKSFMLCKTAICKEALLFYYDPTKPVYVSTDASPVGIAAVLSHQITIEGKVIEKPVIFVSCALSKRQQDYSQLDREGLAIIFGVTRLKKYILGRHFYLVTDNLALKHIFNPNKSIPVLASQRLQHWAYTLSAFSYTVIHRKSELLCVPDACSRLPSNSVIEDICFTVTLESIPLSVKDVASASRSDPILSKVLELTKVGWPHHNKDPNLDSYFKLRNCLSIQQQCLMFGSRVCIPQILQSKVLKLLHEGHPGVVRTKLLARSFVWWPSINSDIEKHAKNCLACSSVNFKRNKVFSPWPKAAFPFQRIHIDFFQFNQMQYFIVCDSYSKWINAQPMAKTDALNVSSSLLSLFALWGLPSVIVADNGPPFDSRAFETFCSSFDIVILHSPPYHAASNGCAERSVQICKKALRKIHSEESSNLSKSESTSSNVTSHSKLSTFLFNYRNTPSTATGKTPNQMLLSFYPRTLISSINPACTPTGNIENKSPFKPGDIVLLKIGNAPVLKGTVLKRLSATTYLVDSFGVLKKPHINQMVIAPPTI